MLFVKHKRIETENSDENRSQNFDDQLVKKILNASSDQSMIGLQYEFPLWRKIKNVKPKKLQFTII